MATSEHAVQLAEALLQYCEIDPAGFRETNKALITFDYETVIIVAVDGQLIHLAAMLGPAPNSPNMHKSLLNRNFDALAESAYRYAIDPGSGELVMSLCVPSEGLESDGFIRTFVAMVDYASLWGHALYAGSDQIPELPGVDAAAQARNLEPHEGVQPGSSPFAPLRA
ncbi:MAG: type III secretion system chaperone [Gammaproteobacteria bacterium]|nr:type III secretion system chaperone [Gammaproteobacteria bacterium]MDE0273964.1 type III secretion system chaperone [Gammaproteobacteria bacterium]